MTGTQTFRRRWSMQPAGTLEVIDAVKKRAVDEGLVVSSVESVSDEYVAGEWIVFVTLMVWRRES